MKHIKVNGNLLNMDKRFGHLKQKQKEKISEWLYLETLEFYNLNGKMPNKNRRNEILNTVYEKIQENSIWIPYSEVVRFYQAHFNKYEKRIKRNI